MNVLQRINRNAKWVALICIGAMLNAGCSSTLRSLKVFPPKGRVYKYVYHMSAPADSKELVFRDAKILIRFDIDDGAVTYNLRNLSKQSLVVLSGSASIGVNDVYSSVRSTRNYYSDSTKFLFTTPILPQGLADDFVLPKDNVYYDGAKWVEKDLFLTADKNNAGARRNILKNVGAKVDLVLPVRVGNELTEYAFTFKVANILSLNPDSVKEQGSRLPAPPMPVRTISSNEQWTTIGIVAGVVLFSTFLFTRDKKFPGNL